MRCSVCTRDRDCRTVGHGLRKVDLCKRCYGEAAALVRERIRRYFAIDPDATQDWHEWAICAAGDHHPNLWFAEVGSRKHEMGELSVRRAKRACAQCPVRKQCYDEGAKEEWGMRAGLTPRERREGVYVDGTVYGRPHHPYRREALDAGFLAQVRRENLATHEEVHVA